MRFPYSSHDPQAWGLHFAVGSFCFAFFIRFFSPSISFFLVFLLAIGKELFDVWRGDFNDFSLLDFLMTLVGAFLTHQISLPLPE